MRKWVIDHKLRAVGNASSIFIRICFLPWIYQFRVGSRCIPNPCNFFLYLSFHETFHNFVY
uniref:Uncharacterized protein n=1 Tax=Arundo donax TaxID=35708 RepID=A0A0A9DV69_ARUDO